MTCSPADLRVLVKDSQESPDLRLRCDWARIPPDLDPYDARLRRRRVRKCPLRFVDGSRPKTAFEECLHNPDPSRALRRDHAHAKPADRAFQRRCRREATAGRTEPFPELRTAPRGGQEPAPIQPPPLPMRFLWCREWCEQRGWGAQDRRPRAAQSARRQSNRRHRSSHGKNWADRPNRQHRDSQCANHSVFWRNMAVSHRV